MDAEQIEREMRVTRASIDRKLDLLTARTAATRTHATRIMTSALAAIAAFIAWRWWRARVEA
jgi:hypothetical protein